MPQTGPCSTTLQRRRRAPLGPGPPSHPSPCRCMQALPPPMLMSLSTYQWVVAASESPRAGAHLPACRRVGSAWRESTPPLQPPGKLAHWAVLWHTAMFTQEALIGWILESGELPARPQSHDPSASAQHLRRAALRATLATALSPRNGCRVLVHRLFSRILPDV